MKSQEALNMIDIDIDYYDVESIIRGFLLHSCLNRMKEFDFNEAFEMLRNPINQKLIEHAQCSFDEYLEYYNDIFFHNDSVYEPFTVQTDYLYIGIEDVKTAIATMNYEKSKDNFSGMFDNLEDLVQRMNDSSNNTEQENIILFDEVIHAQHVTGDIFEDVEIDYIKSEIDKEVLELMGIEV
jgi:hypothetical protein